MIRSFAFLIFIFAAMRVSAQDTLMLINGKTIIAQSIDLKDYSIAYRTNDSKGKLKTIHPERVFSIKFKDGTERLVYVPDTLDPLEFKVEEMRAFIKGEQDARKIYHNNAVKVAGFAT